MNDYQSLISGSKVVLVEFYASWCPHCRRMMPIVDDIKELLGNRVPVYQFDIDENESLADRMGADTVPTFIIYRDGEEVWRYSGEIDGNALYSKIEGFSNEKRRHDILALSRESRRPSHAGIQRRQVQEYDL